MRKRLSWSVLSARLCLIIGKQWGKVQILGVLYVALALSVNHTRLVVCAINLASRTIIVQRKECHHGVGDYGRYVG